MTRPDASGSPASEFGERRRIMIERHLKARGITDRRVLEAMSQVRREEFVPEDLREAAYDDCALPIGFGQTISQPYTVAFMCQSLKLKENATVLEIGTGSGYGAAVLSCLAAKVFTVERIPELAARARETLSRLGFANVDVREANGTLGLPEEAPFDGIVVTAGAEALPETYLQQLADGGRVVIPIGSHSYGQTLYRYTRKQGELFVEDLGGFAFVPLIGRYGWGEGEV
jgi:protein-L-isoaspartate(D-aspartate) O-methyltransferase